MYEYLRDNHYTGNFFGSSSMGSEYLSSKGTWFLAGWNTMSKEEKATYNEEAICHLFGRCVVFCGIGAFLLLYGSFNQNVFILCSGLGIIAIMVILSIVIPKINIKNIANKVIDYDTNFRRWRE